MKTKPFNKFLIFILPKNVIAITLYPFGIYVRDGVRDNAFTLNHEKIHWEQQREMSLVGAILTAIFLGSILTFSWPSWLCLVAASLPWTLFYLWYVIEYLILMIKYGKWAYHHISLEQEAYLKQHIDHYLQYRKPYAWVKYLFS